MTKNEMIKFIKENPYIYITHVLFNKYEYIYSDTDGIIRDESGYVFENWADPTNKWVGCNGIRMRTDSVWETGWSIKE